MCAGGEAARTHTTLPYLLRSYFFWHYGNRRGEEEKWECLHPHVFPHFPVIPEESFFLHIHPHPGSIRRNLDPAVAVSAQEPGSG